MSDTPRTDEFEAGLNTDLPPALERAEILRFARTLELELGYAPAILEKKADGTICILRLPEVSRIAAAVVRDIVNEHNELVRLRGGGR